MLDIGGWEFLLIAILGIIIIGPKELPGAIRTVTMFMRRARELARDFQSGIEEVAREAELDKLTDDIREIAADGTGAGALRDELQGVVDPDGTLAQAMDYDADWTDDDLIDYDDPEFADDKRIGAPGQKDKAAAEDGKPAAENVTDVDNVQSAGSATDTPADTAPADGQTDATDAAPESAKKPDGAS
jgi:sec-independent protein translocase protein TatB